MIPFACPACRKPLQASDDQVGRMIVCPQCQGQVQVPAPVSVEVEFPWMWIFLGAIGLALLIIVCLGTISANAKFEQGSVIGS